MDTKLVLEVPDTPDRSVIAQPVGRSSGDSTRGVYIVERYHTTQSDQRISPTATKYAHCSRGSGLVDVCGGARLSTAARLTDLSSKINESKPSPQEQSSMVALEQKMSCNDGRHGEKAVELGYGNPFPHSHPTRFRDSRKDGKQMSVDSESGENGGCSGLPIGRQQNGVGISLKLPVSASKEKKHRKNEKGADLISDLQVGTKKIPSKSSQQRNVVQRGLAPNGYNSSHDMAKSDVPSEVDDQSVMNSLNDTACSLLPGIGNQVTIKGRDMHDASQFKTRHSLQRQSQFNDASPRNTGCRKLVHDGCSSPNNVVKGKAVAKRDDDGKVVFNEPFDGASPCQIHFVSPNSEGSCADKRKGKDILDDNEAPNMQETETKPQVGRECSRGRNRVTVFADLDDDTLRSPKGIGWRTRQVHIGKASGTSFCEGSSASKREDTISILSVQNHEIATGDGNLINLLCDSPEKISFHGSTRSPLSVTSESESDTGKCHRRRKKMKGKKKCDLANSCFGECSNPTLDDSEILYIKSSRQTSNRKLTRTQNCQPHGTFMRPVLEVDQPNSPEVRCSNPQGESCGVFNDSSARSRQVESDEVLACQLQEQFYHELQEFGDPEEIDATLAWSLQVEEDAQHAASIARQGQPYSRDASIAHLYAHHHHALFQNVSPQQTSLAQASASTRVAQSRRNFNGPEMDLEMRMISELRRSFTSAEMDLETRLNFLEALEAAFENSHDMDDDILPIHHDFNGDDYEMLLALDDDDHHDAGASEGQIDSLPQSVIQADNIKEACAVCLEVPSAGDVIRHLPCLHKFHKECIDPWLRRRTSCPICKSGIS